MIGVKVIDYFGAEVIEVVSYFYVLGVPSMEVCTTLDGHEECSIVQLSTSIIVDESRDW